MNGRRLAVMAVLAVLLAAGGLWAASWHLVAPAASKVGQPPASPAATAFVIPGAHGQLRGWLVPSQPARGIVLLMHCVRCNRLAMLGRVRFLHEAGYHTVLFDFQAHGESSGKAIGFGYREADDARLIAAYARRQFGALPMAAIGFSMGGAAALLGRQPLAVDALVLEAVYPDLETATQNRLIDRLGPYGGYLAPLLLWQLPERLDIALDQLSPELAIRHFHKPLLVMGGSRDSYTTPADTRRLFDAANAPKSLWMVPGARHEDLHGRAPQEYERRVLAFFDTTLAKAGTPQQAPTSPEAQ